jgi:vacuole morphology and inheritance protein 14
MTSLWHPHASLSPSIIANTVQLGADSELSVKNGAELLDRLIKDIVSESAATYVSILETSSYEIEPKEGGEGAEDGESDSQRELRPPSEPLPTAFSLPRFIPLLKERVWVMNPFTRMFLVGWITLLDSIPDLELVTYLPEFLGGLLKFLGGHNPDVHAATQTCLDRFLSEIKRIARVKKGIADSKKSKGYGKRKREKSADSDGGRFAPEDDVDEAGSATAAEDDEEDGAEVSSEDDWVPGQDVVINYKAIMEILTATLDSPLGMTELNWASRSMFLADV